MPEMTPQNVAERLYKRASNPNVARLVFIQDEELELLRRVASGELAPVIHAHWIVNTDDFTPKKRCSACGYNKPIIAGENVGQEPDTHCPSCDALMDGKEDNHE